MRELRETVGGWVALASGMIVGAAAMYVLDPESGGRRRALARDKMVRAATDLRWHANRQARNLRNHLYGTAAEWRSALRDRARPLPDDVLEQRVRAQLGHVVAHPGSLEVFVDQGHVTVAGPVLAGEIEKLQQRLAETRGVHDWDLQVSVHEDPGSVPGLQGESRWQRRQRTGTNAETADEPERRERIA